MDILNLFAETGIILLLFIVGMEFPIQKLRNIGKKASVIVIVEALGTLAIGFVVAQSLHYSVYNSLFLAAVIEDILIISVLAILRSVASTGHVSFFPNLAISVGIVLALIAGVLRTAFGLSSSGGELALVVAKSGSDISGSSSCYCLCLEQ